MKRLFFLGLAIVLSLTACQKTEKRYTQQSVEIDTYKKVIDAYEKQDWEALMSHYADTAKIMNNVIEKEGKTIAEEVAIGKEDAALFSSWDYVDGESEYEMVVTDKGQTWVNFWGIWKGTLAANNKTYTLPTHITAQFVDGKVVKEFGYWDVSKIMMDIQTMEQAELSTMKDTIN
ncbi:MAG TPA: nuclear transport factor 2 family protein [Aequorivita sp.]|jgi:hypothetical protein|nr:hypothetical protein [Aequorivita sp.]HNP69002.1 nuclear transport factor 2 family protein [Aequorivita sp.]|tara:strand:+ start:1161 stop:1685 length:525 start_codon:yes stop_codon:yes gene_type:complete